jgi:hypothetical protein
MQTELPRLRYKVTLTDSTTELGKALASAINDYNATDGEQDFLNYLHNACPYKLLVYPTNQGYNVYRREKPQTMLGLIYADLVPAEDVSKRPFNLEQYRDEYEINIKYQAEVYTKAGNSKLESPMWFIFANAFDGKLKFESSQLSRLVFFIPIKDEYAYDHYEPIRDYFRDVKYAYLRKNYPTIFAEIKG